MLHNICYKYILAVCLNQIMAILQRKIVRLSNTKPSHVTPCCHLGRVTVFVPLASRNITPKTTLLFKSKEHLKNYRLVNVMASQIAGNSTHCSTACPGLIENILSFVTHWGRVTHLCVGKLTIIGSDNSLSPGRRQAIIWTNAGILLIEPLGTNLRNFNRNWNISIQENAFENIVCEMASIFSRPQCGPLRATGDVETVSIS